MEESDVGFSAREIIPRLRQVVGVDGEARDAGPRAGGHRPSGEGFVKERDERFWQTIGERPQAGPEARTENECLGHASPLARKRS